MPRASLSRLLLFFTACLVWPHDLAAETGHFRCRGTDKQTRKLVFTCSGVEIRRKGVPVSAEIVYRTARGKVFAKEKINFRKDALAPDVLFQDLRDGRREMVEREGNHFSVIIQDSAKAEPEFARLQHPGEDEQVLTMPGLPAYLATTMEQMPVESRLTFRVLFPQERKMLKLRAILEANTRYQRREALRVRVQPQNFVYRWFSQPVFLTIQKKNGRLLRYEGLHYVRNPENGHGTIVDLVFSW
ncbi:MAG TPA: hypothetical protein PKM44_03850 [Turneriella sp.]|nr:hypothetical protein [Turneriella sp.]